MMNAACNTDPAESRRCRRLKCLESSLLIASLLVGSASSILSCSGPDESKATTTAPSASIPVNDDSAVVMPPAATGTPAVAPVSVPVMPEDAASTASGTRYIDLSKGDGKQVDGDDLFLTVHYTGQLADGTIFDSSVERGSSVTLPLEQAIPGWREGTQGMRIGGKRVLWVPADQAYGEQGAPPVIAPNSDLVFEVELLDINRWSRLPEKMPGTSSENEMTMLESGVQISDIEIGTGDKVDTDHNFVRVNAKAYLTDGQVIYDSGQVGGAEDLPVQLFPGWRDGLQGLAVGGQRKIVIPWHQTLINGQPQQALPPGASIIFDVNLIAIDPWSNVPDPLPGWQATSPPITSDSGLKSYEIEAGDGATPTGPETNVRVHYTGYLVDGSVFDSSYDRDQPVDFMLGQVIPGWSEGVGKMQVGSKRKLLIPSELAYGKGGSPPAIPPHALLIFDVELIDVDPTEPLSQTSNGDHDHSGHDHDHGDHDHSGHDHDHGDHDHGDHDHDHSGHDHD